MLLEGVPGSVVATEVGFFDQSHFGRHFKRCCGMTPSMFIQRAAANTGNAGKHGNVSAKASAVRSASAIRSSC
jgi:AraC-like DNA-binding protein